MRQVVYLEWDDHCQYPSGWMAFQEVTDNKPCKIVSVGFIIAEDAKCISIASCYDTANEGRTGKGVSTILKNCITKRRKVKL